MDVSPSTAAPVTTAPAVPDSELDQLRWLQNAPYWLVHVAAVVGVALIGFSWAGLIWLAVMYSLHIFSITGAYHRYFSHRSYKTGRIFQFLLALLGVTSVQKGPLWWAAHHRNHHKYSDEPEDIHSPRQRGFWWSHMFWILVERHKKADFSKIKDLTKYPELVFIDRFEILFTVAYAAALYFAAPRVSVPGMRSEPTHLRLSLHVLLAFVLWIAVALRGRAAPLVLAGSGLALLVVLIAAVLRRETPAHEPAVSSDGRIVVAVADFVNQTQDSELDGLSVMLITSLEQSRRLAVLTRSRMIDLLHQLRRDAPDLIDEPLDHSDLRFGQA